MKILQEIMTIYEFSRRIGSLPMSIEPAVAQALYARHRRRETRLMCLREWKDGTCARNNVSVPKIVTNWYSCIVPFGLESRYMNCKVRAGR